MIETLPNLAQRRDKVVADTEEWLRRTTHLANTVLFSQFPEARKVSTYNLVKSAKGPVLQRRFSTPFIVLPAQELHSHSDKTSMIRRVAVKMYFGYDYPASESKDILEGIRSATMPLPDVISIADPQPVVLPQDIESGRKLYEWDSRSISGNRLKLLPWAVFNAPSGGIPHNSVFSGDDETNAFSILRDYPTEALAKKPGAIDFHQRNLDNFINAVSEVTLALQNPELNPR